MADFNRILKTGLTVNAELIRGSSYRFIHRYLTREPDLLTTTEVDRRGYVRTTVTGLRPGSEHQAIRVGNSIFELSGDGSWTARTNDEYKAAEAARSAAQRKAFADKDMKTFRELRAKYNPAAAAVAHFSIKVMETALMLAFAKQGVVVTYLGDENPKGRTLRAYKYNGASPEMLRPGPHELRLDITFWFDASSGALVKTHVRLDWIYDSKTDTNESVYEWELDPNIVITPPQIGQRRL